MFRLFSSHQQYSGGRQSIYIIYINSNEIPQLWEDRKIAPIHQIAVLNRKFKGISYEGILGLTLDS